MHELGVITHVINILEKLAVEKKLTAIGSVTLEVGEVSAIVPEYVTDCWKYCRAKSDILKDSDLKIEILPAVTVCESCGKTYETVKFAKQCPHCASYDTHLLCGNEFSIKEIEAC